MNPLAPEFTHNLVRKTARILDGMDRVMSPGGIATNEGLSAAVRTGMQHLAAHNGDVRAALAAAKVGGSASDGHFGQFINASDEPPEVPIQAFPPINEGVLKALEEQGVSPGVARELAEGEAAAAIGLLGALRGARLPQASGGGDPSETPIVKAPLTEGATAAAAKEATKGAASAVKRAVPSGFVSGEEFSRFGSSLDSGLAEAGYKDAQGILQGSAVTGKSYGTGAPFDAGRKSDLDIGIFSKSLFEAARKAGIKLRSQGTRTGPLSEKDLEKLDLIGLARKLSELAGRPVYFMLYSSEEGALGRAPSIIIPR